MLLPSFVYIQREYYEYEVNIGVTHRKWVIYDDCSMIDKEIWCLGNNWRFLDLLKYISALF